MSSEADTCRKYVVPKLESAGWDRSQHSYIEQKEFTDGRVTKVGDRYERGPKKRADYILRYSHDFSIAVVEAKADYKLPADGLQQAKDYAEILGLKFAYSTNGRSIVEFNYFTGLQREMSEFPAPDELWSKYCEAKGLKDDKVKKSLLTPNDNTSGKVMRYYQQIAIDRTVEAILGGQKRILLTLATGTGKTDVAFQTCWKLWNARWNRTGEYRKPKVLYLSDRTILVDDPKDKTFAPFGDARWRIESGKATKGREIYFTTYQAIAEDESRTGLYRDYSPDFFDLIIVDECHRGSARDESNWREILQYFKSAYQLGMTATPLRDVNRDTYEYFGKPLYTYSLRQGIEDGFLAPYRVHRIVTNVDAAGWMPYKDQRDKDGKPIPQGHYGTKEFESLISLHARTEAIARNITEFMKSTDRFAKTMVFCVDQEHALDMQKELNNCNADLVRQYPDYVCRVTADEGDLGKAALSRFQELETRTPVILTTSRLLSTGVDAPLCRNIIIARVIESIVEFKQIIGRGTRIREDYGKLFFNILDYTGSAIVKFSDPEFDGDPLPTGKTIPGLQAKEGPGTPREKYHVDEGYVTIDTHLVYEMDKDGRRLRVIELRDYTAERVRAMYVSPGEVRKDWVDVDRRNELVLSLEDKGISLKELAEIVKRPDVDPFDLLCNLAFNAPIKTRWDRADQMRNNNQDFFDRYTPEAKEVLNEILQKYADHGVTQFSFPDILKVPPISNHGNIGEIAGLFGGAEHLRDAITKMQSLIYSE